MWRKLGAEIFQQSVGEIPGNRNKKKRVRSKIWGLIAFENSNAQALK